MIPVSLNPNQSEALKKSLHCLGFKLLRYWLFALRKRRKNNRQRRPFASHYHRRRRRKKTTYYAKYSSKTTLKKIKAWLENMLESLSVRSE